MPEQRQAEIRAETAEVLAFYAERYGIVPPEFTVLVDPALDIAADAGGRRIRIGRHTVDYPLIGGTIAHEYTHVLQHYLQGLPPREGSSSPFWLIEGQATYAGGLFFQDRGDRTGDEQRWRWWRESLDVTPPLRDLTAREPFYAEGGPAYALGALATEWLVARAEAREEERVGGAATALDFVGRLPDFYDAFEAYRADSIALRAPHLTDDRDGTALMFLGDVPDALREEIDAELDRVHPVLHRTPRDHPSGALGIRRDRCGVGGGAAPAGIRR